MMQHINNFYTLKCNKKLLSVIKKILFGVIICLIIASCSKSDGKCSYSDSSAVAPIAEVDSLQKILTDSGLVATANASGFFYKINQPGTGSGISNLCSAITVTYKGSFFNGKAFDSSAAVNSIKIQLGQVILGWQKGVPLISKGGDITLYIPPTLGYGSTDVRDQGNNVVIPANSYLIFNIHILDIQ